ncbi:MAG: Ig-like domain-containing domain [Chryseolinea sp.]
MKPIHYLHLILLVITIFALSCARQTSPTGGPKDSIPPTVDHTFPKDQQTNFEGKQIEAVFDETVQLNNPKDQIIISPGVGKDFQATVRKNTVVITLNNPLQPNTTYTVNLRDAVQDITEKNPAQNVHLAFSTGSYIDSLHLMGRVYEVLSAKEGKDATVGLYEQDTFNIFKHKPAYFTKADIQGNFHIDNLKPGNYHLYAWLDNNKNLIVDSKSEAYGFIPDGLNPQDSIPPASIPLVRLDARPLKLTSARPTQTFFNIKTSKSTDGFHVSSKDHELYASYGADHENIQIYNTMQLAPSDSLPINFTASDSLLQSIDTTLYIKFSQRAIKPQPFQLSAEQFSLSAVSGQLNGKLVFNKPVLHINYDSIFYRIDTAQVVSITPTDVKFDSTRTTLTIRKQIDKALLQPKAATAQRKEPQQPRPGQPRPAADQKAPKKKQPTNNEFYAAAASFLSVENDSSKVTALTLKPTTMETTGVIIVEIKTNQRPLLVQLISKDQVIAQQPAKSKTIFPDLQPGDYSLRVIVDTDGNNRWTPGNILHKQPPESIHFYRSEDGKLTITLKANWERELLITF